MCTQSGYAKAALAIERGGCTDCGNDWVNAVCVSNAIQALEWKDRIEDYYSDETQALYNSLLGLIGVKCMDGITINPNAQPPSGIVIVVEAPTLPPVTIITYGDMTLSGTRYDNPLWAGFIPFMQLGVTTFLQDGVDFVTLPTGGFILSPTGNVPAIYEGQIIQVYNYEAI